jgi:hypothetical protein
MSSKYGIGTGLPVVPNTDDENLRQILLPVHTAVNALAQTTSDVTGKTSYSKSELQGVKSTFLYEKTGKLELIFQNNNAYSMPYASLVEFFNPALLIIRAGSGSGRGIVTEPSGISPGSWGRITFEHCIVKLGGVVAGTRYYNVGLGVIGATPTGVSCGIGVSGGELFFVPAPAQL